MRSIQDKRWITIENARYSDKLNKISGQQGYSLRTSKDREAMKREKELQEDRELRELRKKAVPKAHDVPEWYKDAPKKTKLGGSV